MWRLIMFMVSTRAIQRRGQIKCDLAVWFGVINRGMIFGFLQRFMVRVPTGKGRSWGEGDN